MKAENVFIQKLIKYSESLWCPFSTLYIEAVVHCALIVIVMQLIKLDKTEINGVEVR